MSNLLSQFWEWSRRLFQASGNITPIEVEKSAKEEKSLNENEPTTPLSIHESLTKPGIPTEPSPFKTKPQIVGVPWEILEPLAKSSDIDPLLIAAIIIQESGGNTWAARFEPGWAYYTDIEFWAKKNGSSAITEKTLQATSMGLMQVMGAVAREHSFGGWLTELFDPRIGLWLGVKHLASHNKRWGYIWDAVSAYNQGNPRKKADGKYVNADYVESVKRKYHDLRAKQEVKPGDEKLIS